MATKPKYDVTTDSKNQFVTRYAVQRSPILVSEHYYLVSEKDLAKDQTFEKLKIRPSFVGESNGAKYVIISFTEFSKILDKDGFKKDLEKTAISSIREDPSEDDYFKLLYSNTLRHLAFLFTHFVQSWNSQVRTFVTENINFLSTELRKDILEKVGGDVYRESASS